MKQLNKTRSGGKDKMEQQSVEQELSQLIAMTLQWEDELNRMMKMDLME